VAGESPLIRQNCFESNAPRASKNCPCAFAPRPYNARMTEPEPLDFVSPNEVRFRGRTLIYFSGCDYFRLARDERLAKAAVTSLEKVGLNVAASRRTTGNHKIYAQLETALAKFFAAETATVLPDGYLAPLAVAQALTGAFSVALVDEFAHSALLDAARMLDCPLKMFRHRDAVGLAKLLARNGKISKPIVLTDGMFAHDGSVAPLRAYLKILPRNSLVLVDDAHGVGALGGQGRGTPELEGVSRERIIQCGTLSKAFGAYGGFVLGSRSLRRKIIERSRAFIGTTPLPPLLAGAGLAAIRILKREPARRKRLFSNASYLRMKLRAAGCIIEETPGPIVRLPMLSGNETARLKASLLAAGNYPPFLKYGAASAQGNFRFVISSEHTRAQLDKLVNALAQGGHCR
jgi:7-keto-8-aminopelargonate synthetase-like enzyme